jgi:hypothetical protein
LIAQEGSLEGQGVDRLVSVPGEGEGDAEDWVDADVVRPTLSSYVDLSQL